MTSNVVCLYHNDCFDGTGAAWAVSKVFPDAEFIPVEYKKPAPANLVGKRVYIVDFCYPFDELLTIAHMAEEVHIFDHHVGMEPVINQFNQAIRDLGWDATKLRGVYDATVSGAKLTWQQLLPQYPVPDIIEMISDRDLWHFELDETKPVMAALGSYRLDIKLWNALFAWTPDYDPEESVGHPHQQFIYTMEREGHAILRKLEVDVRRIIETCARTITLSGHTVPLVNAPRTHISEVLDVLTEDHPFAVGYFDTPEERIFSLRSRKGTGMDVQVIAQEHGGNGHKHAAGFKVARDLELASI